MRPREVCTHAALEPRVGTREVDVLEDAERLALARDDLARLEPARGQRDHLARLRPRAGTCAPMMSNAHDSDATQ